MGNKSIKEIIENEDNKVMILTNLMIFEQFRKAMIKTVIVEEYQSKALESWNKSTLEDKTMWIKDIAIPQFKDGELNKFLIGAIRTMRLSKEGREFIKILKSGAN